MDGKDIQTIGLAALSVGTILLAYSAYWAYVFPSLNNTPPVADLTTLLKIGWQQLVWIISFAITGIIGILTGTILYGFGRIEEIARLQLRLEESKVKEKPSNA